jgi:glycosyltransferase involved in cell wall biosynthesis
MTPRASAIICTHNPREDYLQRVLEGLRLQSLPTAEWELLLVDNRSTEPVSTKFDLSWHPNAHHIREEELGLTSARLRGIEDSVAEILVFVDDDTVLAPDYLEQTVIIGTEWPFVGVWGGRVVPEYEKPLPAWVGEEIWRLTVVDVKEDVWSNLREGYDTKPVGAGMCVRRSVGLRFAEWQRQCKGQNVKDRTGTDLVGYGDMDISLSALDIGLGTGRSTKLQLTHLIPAGRLTLDYFLRHAEGDAASSMTFRASRGLPISEPRPLSWLHQLRWFVHRLKNRVSREKYEIQKAHYRGLQKGWQLAQRMAPSKTNSGL